VLSVGDATGSQVIRASVASGSVNLRILLEPPTHATHIDVVID
jgi:hypothetical protein